MAFKLQHTTQISNVLVIGSGGAGLRAAIEAKLAGKEVTIIGKRNKGDVHTVLAAGGINAAFGNVDSDDSWRQHFADTYLEGYQIGESRTIEIMAKDSPDLVTEIDIGARNSHVQKTVKSIRDFLELILIAVPVIVEIIRDAQY